ncbi:hypothetical protein V1477_008559 [Vespula maculifrons]|uniref:Trafficking protein particle complex subunit 12 n=1 Tax=Vespula maculifrons TaxID=7453 RepID=A0ABD2CDD3_VESMC|nr:trafficking protein particle complex subunit 12 [Vespula vulgaris]
MAEGNNKMSKDVSSVSEDTDEKTTDISRYFNNAPRTIFDDIVAPNEQNYFNTVSDSEDNVSRFNSLLNCTTNDLFSVDTLLDNDRMSDTLLDNDHMIQSNLHRDAWIPSERTRKILRSIATSTVGTTFLERDNLTMPGLALQGDMPDLIKTAVSHFLGEDEEMQRNVLTASDVTQDERGLRKLIQTGCYRAAINLSGRLISIYAQGYGKINQSSKHTPHSLYLWYTRLSLLAKLKQNELLEKESKPFGDLDKPDMYYTFYPELYGTKPGSMASFAFRLLLAEVPYYYGKPKEALDKLHKVLSVVNEILSNLQAGLMREANDTKVTNTEQKKDAIKLWSRRKSRVLISIINCAVGMKNYILAVDILEELSKSHDWTTEQLQIFRSSIGRIYLFLGDVSTAETLLNNRIIQTTTTTVRELVDRGLIAVAKNSFQEAFNYFQTASTMDPSNVMLLNNMAVCLLYTGQLKAAVHLYENAVARNPMKSLQEPILLNMCTSYELHTNHCKQTKLHLLRQLNKYKGDAIDIQCLKLGM